MYIMYVTTIIVSYVQFYTTTKILDYTYVRMLVVTYVFQVYWIGQECVKNQFGKIKLGKNIKILIIVVELQNVWQIKFGDLLKFAKFDKIFSRHTFVL